MLLPQKDGPFYHCPQPRKSFPKKMRLPGDKLVNRANTAEKLNILIAHYIQHLRP